jgi:hypothetical protein
MAAPETHDEIWIKLKDAFPQSETRAGTSVVYEEMLKDIPCDALRDTVNDGIATAWHFTRMPTIAEIRQHWTALRVRKLGVPSGPEAWGEVMVEIRRCGQYRTPKFSSQLVVDAVRAVGGWMLLTEMQSMDEVAPNRARFIEAYDVLLERARHTATMTPEVRDGLLGQNGHERLRGPASLAQLMAPQDAETFVPQRVKPKVYRQPTPEELASGDFKTPRQLRDNTEWKEQDEAHHG